MLGAQVLLMLTDFLSRRGVVVTESLISLDEEGIVDEEDQDFEVI